MLHLLFFLMSVLCITIALRQTKGAGPLSVLPAIFPLSIRKTIADELCIIVFTLAVLSCASVNLPSFVIYERVSKNSHSAYSDALGVGRRVSLSGSISKAPYPRQQFHTAIIDARVYPLIVRKEDLTAKVPSCFPGQKSRRYV